MPTRAATRTQRNATERRDVVPAQTDAPLVSARSRGSGTVRRLTQRDQEAAHLTARWRHVQPLWRAIWPSLEALNTEVHTIGVWGNAGIAALGELPAKLRSTVRIEAAADPQTAQVAEAAFPGLGWMAPVSIEAQLPPGYLDLALAEIEADARLSDRTASFVSRLRRDEERLIDLVTALRSGALLAAFVHGGLFERAAGSARERLHDLADLIAMAKVPAEWACAGSAPAALDLALLRRRAPQQLKPAHARYLSLTNITLGTRDTTKVRTRLNGYYQEAPMSRRVGVFGDLEPLPTAGGYTLAVRARTSPSALQAYLAQATADYARRMQASPQPQPRQITRRDEVLVRPPHGMADMFSSTDTVRLPRDIDDRPIALVPGRLLVYGGLIYEISTVATGEIQMKALEGLPARSADALFRIVQLRDAIYETLHSQAMFSGEHERQQRARDTLNALYDEFVRRHGPLNAEHNRRLYAMEPDSGRLAALEIYSDESGVAQKAEIFSGNVIDAISPPSAISTLADAYAASLDALGTLSPSDIGQRLGADSADIEQQLVQNQLGYFNPEERAWQTAAQYLSGDVVSKLAVAAAWAKRDARFDPNVEALALVQPTPIPADQISVRIGAPWIPEDVVKGFLDDLYGGSDVAEVAYQPLSGTWTVEVAEPFDAEPRNTTEWGTDRRPFPTLLESALNQRTVEVHDAIEGTSKLNVTETLLAQERLAMLEHRFTQFLWADPERRDRLAQIYNFTYNRFRAAHYDGQHLTFPGMNRQLKLRPDQRSGVWRFLVEGNLLLARKVGRGKTFTQVTCAMKAKQLGRALKPAWAVPDHLLDQADREARRLYPTARILNVSSFHLEAARRERTLEKVAGEDWDLVIYSHTALGSLRLRGGAIESFQLYQQAREMQEAVRVSPGRLRGAVQRRLTLALKELRELHGADPPALDEWARLGHDMLLLDEAHRFKNLAVSSNLEVGITGSQRASDLLEKILALYRAKGEQRGVVFATGTPLSNSLLELYNLQRYLQPQRLETLGLRSFRLWARLFLKPVVRYEPELTGEGFRARTRYVLQNAPEALAPLRTVLDMSDGLEEGVEVPDMHTVNVVAEMSPAQVDCMQSLRERLKAIRSARVDPRQDNTLRIVTDGRKLGLDARLLDPEAADWAETKVARLADNVASLYRQWAAERGVQLVFCDLGVPNGRVFNVYADLRDKLIARGIPAEEIACVHDYPGEKRPLFFRGVRSRAFRVALGTTEMMGEGTELQTGTVAVHHLDGPWRPSDIEQRDGRARRQGNLIWQQLRCALQRFIYTTRDSFDRYMWDTMRFKAETFSRLLRGDPSIRSFDVELDPSYAVTVAITSGNPIIRAQVELEDRVARLRQLSHAHAHQIATARRRVEALNESIRRKLAEIEDIRAIPSGDGSGRWKYSAEVDGLPPESAFEGPTWELYEKIPKYVREFKLQDVRGLSYAGLPIRACAGWDPVMNCPRLEWYLRTASDREVRYVSAHSLAQAVGEKADFIEELEGGLARCKEELVARDKQIRQPFSQEAELQLCARALKVVEEMIQLESKEVPSHVDVEVRRELLRCMMGPDGAALDPKESQETTHGQQHRPIPAHTPRRRHAL